MFLPKLVPQEQAELSVRTWPTDVMGAPLRRQAAHSHAGSPPVCAGAHASLATRSVWWLDQKGKPLREGNVSLPLLVHDHSFSVPLGLPLGQMPKHHPTACGLRPSAPSNGLLCPAPNQTVAASLAKLKSAVRQRKVTRKRHERTFKTPVESKEAQHARNRRHTS